jgi:hypothetical protein
MIPSPRSVAVRNWSATTQCAVDFLNPFLVFPDSLRPGNKVLGSLYVRGYRPRQSPPFLGEPLGLIVVKYSGYVT